MVRKNLKLKRVLIIILVSILVLLLLNLVATKMIYDSLFSRYDCGTTAYPEELASTVQGRQSLPFLSGENTLSGYLYRSSAETPKDSLILLAAGHNACADEYLWQIKELLACGWSVFTFDATGYCASEGASAVGFPQELLDLRAALDYLEEKDRLGFQKLILLGHSRGGYAACCALAYDYSIDAVISVSGINSAMEGIMGASETYVGKLAYVNYGPLWLYQTMLFGSEIVDLDVHEILSETDTPVLVIQGEQDTLAPADKHSIYSYKDTIQSENVTFLLRSSPDNAGHTDLLYDADKTANDELIREISAFIEKIEK